MGVILLAKNPPPFVDYPDWVYQGFLFHGVLTDHSFAGYALKHYPVPNSTTTIGLSLLDMVLPWQWAAKVWVCLYLSLAGFATWILSRTVGSDWRLFLALPGIAFLNLNFWYGHINFEIGVCLVIILLAMLLRGPSILWTTLLLIAIFFTHMEACACALLMVGAWCFQRKRFKLLWACVPTVLLTGWYAAARFSTGNMDAKVSGGQSYRYASPPFLVYKVNMYFKTFGYVNACDLTGRSLSEIIFGRGLYLALIVASLCIAVMGLLLIARFFAFQSDPARQAVRVFAGILLAISLLLPHTMLGTSDPGSRLLLMLISVTLFFIPWRQPAGTAVALLSVLFCMANLWQFAIVSRDPAMFGHVRDLPEAILKYGHVEPATRLIYYERLGKGELDETIFPTALFLEDKR